MLHLGSVIGSFRPPLEVELFLGKVKRPERKNQGAIYLALIPLYPYTKYDIPMKFRI